MTTETETDLSGLFGEEPMEIEPQEQAAQEEDQGGVEAVLADGNEPEAADPGQAQEVDDWPLAGQRPATMDEAERQLRGVFGDLRDQRSQNSQLSARLDRLAQVLNQQQVQEQAAIQALQQEANRPEPPGEDDPVGQIVHQVEERLGARLGSLEEQLGSLSQGAAAQGQQEQARQINSHIEGSFLQAREQDPGFDDAVSFYVQGRASQLAALNPGVDQQSLQMAILGEWQQMALRGMDVPATVVRFAEASGWKRDAPAAAGGGASAARSRQQRMAGKTPTELSGESPAVSGPVTAEMLKGMSAAQFDAYMTRIERQNQRNSGSDSLASVFG